MNNFFHSGSGGDIIYSLPTIIALGGGRLHLRDRFYGILASLLHTLPYLDDVILNNYFYPHKKIPHMDNLVYENGVCAFNLDRYRNIAGVHNNTRHLAKCHLDIFNQSFDLSQAWIVVKPKEVAPIVINRSERYHDKEEIDWDILRPYAKDIIYIGRSGDNNRFPLRDCTREYILPKKRVGLEFAQVIKGSRLFIGNQSLGFALAEAMKHPRVLEVFHNKPNCMPMGNYGYTYLDEELIERYVYGKSS